MSRLYLDHAAATPLSPVAWMAMEPFLLNEYGNPSSVHAEGVRAKQALEKARSIVSQCIGAHSDEVLFTSGATESIHLAILGALKAGSMKGKHVVTVATEHAAVLEALRMAGADVTVLPVDYNGRIETKHIVDALRENTVLVSIMMVNNEIGVVHDIADVGRAIDAWRKKRSSVYPLLHSDASQAPNYFAIDVAKLHVDLLTLSSAKVYGPKGVGALFLKRHTPWAAIFGGGKQEHGRRPGTENIAGIVGFATALRETVAMREQESQRLEELREQLIDHVLTIPYTRLNGHRLHRSPNNVNIAFQDIDGEELVLRFDAKGIAVSTGSACKGGAEFSHVLTALGIPLNDIRGSIRFSLGRSTTHEDIDYVFTVVHHIVESMRKEYNKSIL
jgi:cysteine desulfurase